MKNGIMHPAPLSVSSSEETPKKNLRTTLLQFVKFGFVGVLNTLIDFGTLNLLSWLTGITKGVGVTVIAVISFTLAITNSYFWNKFWTFRQKKTADTQTEVGKFIVVSLIGAAMNAAIVYIVSTRVSPLFGLSERLWLNVAKLTSTVFVFAWNFLGYKYWAFRKRA